MLTETALGRATDHLYDALPKAVRKELAALPDTVRRLERNATTLRASIDSCDEHLAAFERSGRRDAAVEAELREARDLAADRLAQTIAALESIRLDLLRLQMGRVGVESVTASLAAAQRVEHADRVRRRGAGRGGAAAAAGAGRTRAPETRKTTTPTRRSMACRRRPAELSPSSVELEQPAVMRVSPSCHSRQVRPRFRDEPLVRRYG